MLTPEETNAFDATIGPVKNDEEVIRLLFHPQMVNDKGEAEEVCFSTKELMEERGSSVSILRSLMLADKFTDIRTRLEQMENPAKLRAKFGCLLAVCDEIRRVFSNPDEQNFPGRQVFKVVPDPKLKDGSIDPPHAKICRASPDFTKGFIRGYRGELLKAFNRLVKLTDFP